METRLLRCVRCAASLRQEESAYRCQSCASVYPVRRGVPLFVPDVRIEPSGFELSPDVAAYVCQRCGIANDAETYQALTEIFAHNYQLADMVLTAENNYFFERIRAATPPQPEPAPAAASLSGTDVPQLSAERHHLPSTLPLNQTRSWNVRLVNSGKMPLPAQGDTAGVVISRWLDKRGNRLDGWRERTALPVDLAPGRALTLPIWVASPATSGDYQLELVLLQNQARPIEQLICSVPVRVQRRWDSGVPCDWQFRECDPLSYDYVADHEMGRTFFKEELGALRGPVERVLEVGVCCNPMCWDVPAEVVSIDIDVQTLQVGQFSRARTHPHLQFACADAAHLPYVDGAFDCAVMFATLHHFVDPVRCLQELRRVVRPEGFVALLCEPLGSYRAETLDSVFRYELNQGINEQIFTAEEYGRMFREAGLVSSRAVIDGGSFKVILRHPQPGQRPQQTKFVNAPPWKMSKFLRSLAGRVKRRLSRLVKAS